MTDRTDRSSKSDGDETDDTIPEQVIDEAERLTRLARDTVDENEATAYLTDRDQLLAEYGYEARVRDEDDVLVCYPTEWLEDGLIRLEQVENVDRGIERPLTGHGDTEDWERVDDHNRTVVDRVRETHGRLHAENASAFADFMSNHYAKPIETATDDQIKVFVTEYFPRNAWPTDDQRAVLEESVAIAIEIAESVSDSSR